MRISSGLKAFGSVWWSSSLSSWKGGVASIPSSGWGVASVSSSGWGMGRMDRRGFYVKKRPVEEENAIQECSSIINSNPAFAIDLFEQLNRGGRDAISRKIFRDYIKKRQMPPDLVLKEFCKILGRDPDIEFRKADRDQDGLVTDTELKEWSSSILMKSRTEDAPTKTQPLTPKQKYAVFVNQTVPFIGFGFMDNAIMILAGDKIDMTLGLSLGLSTMAAAGLGNLLSDVCGIGFGGAIEAASQKIGLPSSDLTAGQHKLPEVKVLSTAGQVFGIAVGCLIGMVPLLWLNQEDRKLRAIFDSFDRDGNGFIDVQEIRDSLEASGISISIATVESIVEALDSETKDGKLAYSEFKEFMCRLQRVLGQTDESELVKFFRGE